MVESSIDNEPLTEPLLQQTDLLEDDRSETIGNSQTEQVENVPTEKDLSLTICGKTYFMNHNVVLNLILAVLYGISDSIWSGTVFAAYLKTLGHGKNIPVGNIEAVNGLAVLFSALPVGYLADRYSRSLIIKIGGVLIAFTAIVHISVLKWIGVDMDELSGDNSMEFLILAIVMGLWGIGGGIVSGPTQALYADSTPLGERTKYYHYLFVCYMISSCCGPIVSIILFQSLGDDWDLKNLRTICYIGLGMEFFNSFIMFFFDDAKALDEDTEEDENEQENITSPALPSYFEEGAEGNNEISEMSCRQSNSEDGRANDGEEEESDSPEDSRMKERRKWIPYIMFASNLIFAIGSGMTVKFFPLFFKDVVGMSPTEVQCVYLIVPIGLAIFSGLGTSLAKIIGRVQTSLTLQLAGILCLLFMAIFNDYLDKHPFILVPIYILRTVFMNGSYPLQESILMDFIPKNERARWKSLESVAQFGWCGSAALGGIISDSSDYTHTFFATVIIQSCGMLVYALLLPLVPIKESDES